MWGLPIAARNVRRWLPIILCTTGLTAQTCLVLSPTAVTADRTALLDLSLYSLHGPAPAAVQWTFQYPSSSISNLTVDDGPSLTSVGKTVVCAGNAEAYNCLAVGLNSKTIADGVIAKVTAVLAPGVTAATIQITNPHASSAAGSDLIPIVARILPARGTRDSSDCRLLPRSRGGR